jgi:hypothetical protein
MYYKKYAKAFVHSAIAHGNWVHVHIINADIGLDKTEHPLASYSFEEGTPRTREYYAANRFFIAPEILMANQADDMKLLILDIDCIIRKKIELPDAAVGLWMREPFGANDWERRGTRVAAGAVMYDSTAWLFAKTVADKIKALPEYWFADQVALAETMDEFALGINVHNLANDPYFMNWDFSKDQLDNAAILTAKGDRKNWPEYQELVDFYSSMRF